MILPINFVSKTNKKIPDVNNHIFPNIQYNISPMIDHVLSQHKYFNIRYGSFDSFSDKNDSVFSEAQRKTFHDDPLFLFHFSFLQISISHFGKCQEHFNFESKMAHLSLKES